MQPEHDYRLMVENSPDGIALLKDGQLVFANKAALRLLGRESLSLPSTEKFEAFIHPEDLGLWRIRERHLQIQGQGALEEVDIRVVAPEGRLLDIELNQYPIGPGSEGLVQLTLRDISVRKSAEEALRQHAFFDALTGLPNRILFQDRLSVALEQARRSEGMLAVMFLDVDRFKVVNESLGHHTGDFLLARIAARLQDCVRKGDTISRLGSDEFTVLLPDVGDTLDALGAAEKILQAFNEPFSLDGSHVEIGVSIGVCLFPEHAQNAQTLITRAEQAMYLAKDNGRNSCQLWSPQIETAPKDRLGAESRLRAGVKNREFVAYYQPKIDIKTGAICGAEALLRWRHPQRGLVMPDDFIALAEETRLILPLGEWVLQEACRQAKAWADAGLGPLLVSVNLSAWQLHNESLVKTVDAALASSGVDPSGIELEITETAAMKNPELTLAILSELSRRGLKLSLDDFGKGYSSLNYLKKFPVNTIKIDQSFILGVIKEEKNAAIVRSVIMLAHHLGMSALAEGVETREHLDFLRAEGCDVAQGFYFSGPVPVTEFEAMVRRS